jgi:hypothetical protein
VLRYVPPSHCRPITVLCLLPGVWASWSDAAQPRDAGELPRGVYVSQDRIVRAVIKGDQDQRLSEVGREEKKNGGWGRNGQGKQREQRTPK